MADTTDDEHSFKCSGKLGKYSRNRSILVVTSDPFAAAAASADLTVEVLTDAIQISQQDFNDNIIGPLKATR
jgi:hypothetical protein